MKETTSLDALSTDTSKPEGARGTGQMKEGWIIIRTEGGSCCAVRLDTVTRVGTVSCDDPAHPLHFTVATLGDGAVLVSREQAVEVCERLGIDPGFLP